MKNSAASGIQTSEDISYVVFLLYFFSLLASNADFYIGSLMRSDQPKLHFQAHITYKCTHFRFYLPPLKLVKIYGERFWPPNGRKTFLRISS